MNEKTTWVLVRGLAREARHWGQFFDRFQREFPDCEVLAIDLPGVGEYKNEKAPLTVPGMRRKLRDRVLERKQKDSQLNFFAVSLGGMVVLDWMSEFPDEISKCVIVNSSSQLSPFYKRLRWEVWKDFFSKVIQPDPKKREEGILQVTSNSPEARKQYLPLWIKLALENSIPGSSAAIQLAAASRFQVPEMSLEDKALFLVGLGDWLVEPECSSELASHFKSPLQKHPWGGHDLAMDDPDWVFNQLHKWLKKA